ncbi:hypothetical protein [Polaribacter sp. IC073]|uniref:hypothetical protein n=1 Tax=Polaribacter sp. IC073 TaxID=2508540 RepID=UPI0011BF14B3|nr:hypothetical protein [Polaribacter sp. IC073]TXD47359.1 hypothetical protein ES045_12235 [Polaribacter sp. IC073]
MNELDLNFDFNLEDFDLDLGMDKNIFDENIVHKPKLHNSRKEYQVKYKNAKQLANDVDIEARNFCIISGNFIFGDFIEALLVENKRKAEVLTISTLSLSQENVDSLHNLITNGYIGKLNMIISDYFYSHERHNLVKYMFDKLNIDDCFQLSVCRTHTKITLIETHLNEKLVIHGSANLRSSDNIEQFMIEPNESLYDFNLEYMDSIKEKFHTINQKKQKGGSKALWETITK